MMMRSCQKQSIILNVSRYDHFESNATYAVINTSTSVDHNKCIGNDSDCFNLSKGLLKMERILWSTTYIFILFSMCIEFSVTLQERHF